MPSSAELQDLVSEGGKGGISQFGLRQAGVGFGAIT